MQFKNIGFGVRGLYAVVSLALRDANMSATAEQRRDALAFWKKHGLAAAMDYAGVCRSTLHAWRAAYQKHGAAGLGNKSRAPRRARRRAWPPALLAEIRRRRKEIPNLGPGYNTKRPHHSLNSLTPCQSLAKHSPQKSRMGWQHPWRCRAADEGVICRWPGSTGSVLPGLFWRLGVAK